MDEIRKYINTLNEVDLTPRIQKALTRYQDRSITPEEQEAVENFLLRKGINPESPEGALNRKKLIIVLFHNQNKKLSDLTFKLSTIDQTFEEAERLVKKYADPIMIFILDKTNDKLYYGKAGEIKVEINCSESPKLCQMISNFAKFGIQPGEEPKKRRFGFFDFLAETRNKLNEKMDITKKVPSPKSFFIVKDNRIQEMKGGFIIYKNGKVIAYEDNNGVQLDIDDLVFCDHCGDKLATEEWDYSDAPGPNPPPSDYYCEQCADLARELSNRSYYDD